LASQNPTLDSYTKYIPFTTQDPFILSDGRAINFMGDHPATKVPVSVIHQKSGRENMITSIMDSREFWTAFVARDPGGAPHRPAPFWITLCGSIVPDGPT
jgi:hypothetical protein